MELTQLLIPGLLQVFIMLIKDANQLLKFWKRMLKKSTKMPKNHSLVSILKLETRLNKLFLMPKTKQKQSLAMLKLPPKLQLEIVKQKPYQL